MTSTVVVCIISCTNVSVCACTKSAEPHHPIYVHVLWNHKINVTFEGWIGNYAVLSWIWILSDLHVFVLIFWAKKCSFAILYVFCKSEWAFTVNIVQFVCVFEANNNKINNSVSQHQFFFFSILPACLRLFLLTSTLQ